PAHQQAAAGHRGGPVPRPLERGARRGHGAIDVLRVAAGDRAQPASGGRVDDLDRTPARGRLRAVVDEVMMLASGVVHGLLPCWPGCRRPIDGSEATSIMIA